jgi:hypothetical protein
MKAIFSNGQGGLLEFLQKNQGGLLGGIFHYHHDSIMLLACFGKFRDEIHCHHFPLPLKNGQWLQKPTWVPTLNLVFLAFHTFSNVLSILPLHAWPIVLSLDCCNCFMISWVPNIRHIMHLFQNYASQLMRIGYINLVLVQENFIIIQFKIFNPLLHFSLL